MENDTYIKQLYIIIGSSIEYTEKVVSMALHTPS